MINDGIKSVNSEIVSFLMAGQSNMAGRGEWNVVEPIENKDCFMLRMGRWQLMSDPVNVDRGIFQGQPRSGISLASSFADEVQKHFNTRVGLIPCADGGTSMEQWMPGEVLFDHAVMQASLAKRTSRLGGILWHQGESNCKNLDPADYKKKFITMMTEFRKQLGDENLPLIIGELSPDIDEKFLRRKDIPVFNALLHEIAAELPNCIVVSSEGLPLKDDRLHFNAVGCREFGKRYFEKYLELIEK